MTARRTLGPGDLLRLGVFGLRTRPTRVVLSALGIAIGIAAMIAVVGISSSSKAALDRVLDTLGTNVLTATQAQGFTEVHSPKIVEQATESGANVFEVDYFGRPAYLAQSPQFYKQQLVGVFERVYEVGPVFRAEPHDTVRHLAEYRSLDVELGFIRDHRDVLAMLREVIAGMVAGIHEHAPDAVERTGAAVPDVPEELPVLHFSEALALVGADPDEPDLAPEHERALGAWAKQVHGSDFLAVEGVPLAAEEARDPVRAVPRGIIVAMGVLAVSAAAVLFLAPGAQGSLGLSTSDNPLVSALEAGSGGSTWLSTRSGPGWWRTPTPSRRCWGSGRRGGRRRVSTTR